MIRLPWIFGVPTEENLTELRSLFCQQKPVDRVGLDRYLRNSDQGNDGDGEVIRLDTMMARLGELLNADYEENLSEPDASWTFEYVVDREGYQDQGITVRTCLRSFDASQGAIYYGSTLYRIGPNEYICWFAQ